MRIPVAFPTLMRIVILAAAFAFWGEGAANAAIPDAASILSSEAHSCVCGMGCRTACCCSNRNAPTNVTERGRKKSEPAEEAGGLCLRSAPCETPAAPVGTGRGGAVRIDALTATVAYRSDMNRGDAARPKRPRDYLPPILESAVEPPEDAEASSRVV